MKKGFTLAELLGVITILGLLILVTMPIVTNILKDSKEEAYQKQVDTIEKVAKEWGVENSDLLPEEGTKVISIDTLISSGKIQNTNVIDPRNNEPMNGCVLVKYNSEYNQYEYNYNEDSSQCESLEN